MGTILEYIQKPWPWYIGGPMIALIMLLLILFGKKFGISSTYKTVCSMGGAGRIIPFFKDDWKDQLWNVVFVLGAIAGGFIAVTWLSNPSPIDLSSETVSSLQELGFKKPGNSFLPPEIFGWDALLTGPGILAVIVGGFLVGFGTRYGAGCTSGHAIYGLSSFQWPSLLAVIGFFIGGLVTTHFLIPYIFDLN